MTNTTPLITLAGIGLLDLLPLLHEEVWAPRIHPDLIAYLLEEAGE